jgi:hypothetical protein
MSTALALLLTIGGLVAMLIGAATLIDEGSESPPNVILVSRGMPQNVGLYTAQIAALDRVESQAELEAALDAETRVIVIDRSMLDALSTPYLSAQLARGVQFVGLNITERQLKTATDWNAAWQSINPRSSRYEDSASWNDVIRDADPFYSLIRMNPGRSGHRTGHLTHNDFFQLEIGRVVNLGCYDGRPWSECVETYDDNLYQLAPLTTPTPR